MTSRRNDIPSLCPLDQLMPRSYVTQILCFPSSDKHIPHALKDGLAKVVTQVPYLVCGIIETRGMLSLSAPHQSIHELLVYKDLTDVIDYAQLQQENFPPSAFNSAATLPEMSGHPSPVFRAALSRVRGGFLLCIRIHHGTTDITGIGTLLDMWSRSCRLAGTLNVIFDRDLMLADVAVSPRGTNFPRLLHVGPPNARNESAGEFETDIFHINSAMLKYLKERVTAHGLPQEVTWISKGDILTAVLWSAVVQAEESSPPESTIRMPVNFRSRLVPPLPGEYLGAAFAVTTVVGLHQHLLSVASPQDESEFVSALSIVAGKVRSAINSVTDSDLRGMLDYLASGNLDGVKLGHSHTDMSIVSWADERVYMSWGDIVGSCERVRLPQFKGKRYPIILPRLPSGDMEVIVSLDTKAMEVLRSSRILRTLALNDYQASFLSTLRD